MLDNIKSWCRHSATIALAYVIAAFGALLEVIPYAVDIVASPDFSAAVRDALPAHWLGLYNIGLAVCVYAARMRSLNRPA